MMGCVYVVFLLVQNNFYFAPYLEKKTLRTRQILFVVRPLIARNPLRGGRDTSDGKPKFIIL